MKILERKNWWVWLLLLLFSSGSSGIVLGALLGVFDNKAWYANWKYWVIASLFLVFPVFIMAYVFMIEIMCKTAAKLNVPGSEIYMSPYIWLGCLIVPILGWIMLSIMIIYITVWPIVMLYRGAGEKYIK